MFEIKDMVHFQQDVYIGSKIRNQIYLYYNGNKDKIINEQEVLLNRISYAFPNFDRRKV